MNLRTTDLCDRYDDRVQVLSPLFHDYGGRRQWHGRIATVKVFEDNSLVREALEINQQQAVAWNTLGVVLMRTGRLEEAEAALSRSISLDSSNVMVHLYLAELQMKRGRADLAREILEQFSEVRDRLSDAELAFWQRLRQALR